MKRVLILAYDFPPYVSVGGLRPYAWYKYLHHYGIYPIVVTRQWENNYQNHLDYIAPSKSTENIVEESEYGTIIRTPYQPNLANRIMLKYGTTKYQLIRKAISGFYEFAQWMYAIGPKVQLYFAARDYLKSNQVDVIIATGDPFILFKYASKLSKQFQLPWYADYRDPWVQDKSREKNKLFQQWDSYWERKCLRHVKGIITVSSFVQKQIASLVKGKTYHIVPNGYDPENIDQVKHIQQNETCMSIAFVGTVYDWHPLESFLRVCNQLIQDKAIELRINFYGTSAELEIKKLIANQFPQLKAWVTIEKRMPNLQLLQKLAHNNLFLLFNDYSILGTKIFDYVALKRKVLLCYQEDEEAMQLKRQYFLIREFDSESQQLQADLLEETQGGYVVKNSNELAEVLRDLYHEFKTTRNIHCASINTEKYSRAEQLKKIVKLIEVA
ncbi:MAG: glycosyltransferase [Flammeovirgaceae bacterium]